jgi:hypothetical protein
VSAADLIKVQVRLSNSQKQARYLCIGDHVIYDERVVRVKDVSFHENDHTKHVEIEAEILGSSDIEAEILGSSEHPVEIMIIEAKDFVFTVVTPCTRMS